MKRLLVWARQFPTRFTRHCAGAFQLGFQSRLALGYLNLHLALCNPSFRNLYLRIREYRSFLGFKQVVCGLDELFATFNSEFQLRHHHSLRALVARIAELVNGGSSQEVQL